jgi:hypothetical protein
MDCPIGSKFDLLAGAFLSKKEYGLVRFYVARIFVQFRVVYNVLMI